MSNIKSIFAYEILDSRGVPTIEGILTLDNDKTVVSSVPAGVSLGKYEALELRDNDQKRFNGMGLSQAVYIVNELINPKLKGISPLKQKDIDNWLIKADGTKNKSKLGANCILLISQLVAKSGALESNLPLYKYFNLLYETYYKSKIKIERIPTPIFNVINGGKYANNNLNFQEYQIIPSSAYSYSKCIQLVAEIFQQLKQVLIYRNANISVGEEGGFTPNFSSNLDGLEVIIESINKKGLKVGPDMHLGLDIASSQFYKNDRYFVKDKSHPLKIEEYYQFIEKVVESYSILTLEDPFYEDDWDSWIKLNKKIGKEMYLIGDDLLATNTERLEKSIKKNACSTVLIKPNQIGTITETLAVIDLARKNKLSYVVSHRSGETNDDLIADLSVAIQSDFVKFGAPSRGERVAKYNRLWNIERQEKLS